MNNKDLTPDQRQARARILFGNTLTLVQEFIAQTPPGVGLENPISDLLLWAQSQTTNEPKTLLELLTEPAP